VLVVVHDGDVEGLLQTFLDIETLGGLDILEVDTSEGGGDALYGFAEFLGIFLSYLDIEDVDTAIDLEEQTLTLHNGFTAHGTDIAESKDGGTVGDDGNEVALVGILISIVGIFLNLEAWESHTWGVG
jgi:hypothetical protein